METLAQLVERLIDKNNFSSLPLIFDYLEEANTQKSWYQYRQLYSAFGQLLGRLKEFEISELKIGKIVTITKEQIFADNLGPHYSVPENTKAVNEWNYNAVLRALTKFKRRVEEIFWEELVPIAKAVPFVQSIVECAQECRTKQSSSGSGVQGIPEQEQPYPGAEYDYESR